MDSVSAQTSSSDKRRHALLLTHNDASLVTLQRMLPHAHDSNIHTVVVEGLASCWTLAPAQHHKDVVMRVVDEHKESAVMPAAWRSARMLLDSCGVEARTHAAYSSVFDSMLSSNRMVTGPLFLLL